MTLRQKGEDWYGDSPADVWDYFVQQTQDSPEPVKHWKQAVCACGHKVFEVYIDEDEEYLLRRCISCEAEHEMFKEQDDAPPDWVPEPGEEELLQESDPNPEEIVCDCCAAEFEVIGITAPFGGTGESAKWFYLGLRCVDCGSIGCYFECIPRYNDHRKWLAML